MLPPSSPVPLIRRKLSLFRPHNWRYPQITPTPVRDSLSLEMLPVVLLEYIFDFLQTPHLLQICRLSKYFYLPAVNRLYKKLIITGDDLALNYAKSHLKNWNMNYGTAISPRNLPRLVGAIAPNIKLALLIRHVVVTCTNHTSHLARLLELTHVTTLYCTKPLSLPPHILGTIQDLLCALGGSIWGGQLRELRISHTNTVIDSKKYEDLAKALVASNTHASLRSLVLETADDERDLRRLNMINQSRGLGNGASWPIFFRVLAGAGVKLNLATLGFDGHFEGAAVSLAELLCLAVELDHLHTLELRCTEVLHGHGQHSSLSTTILDELTQRTPLLRNLDVSPTDNCLTCQMASVSNTISKNLPNQLEQLLLVIESPIQASAESVRMLLIRHQPNLRKLKLVDRSSLAETRGALYQNLSLQDVSLWEHGCFYQYRIQKAFFPCSASMCSPEYEQAQFATDPMMDCIRNCRSCLAEFLRLDPIHSRARDAMPLLKQYTVVDFTINMQEHGVQFNGHTIAFD